MARGDNYAGWTVPTALEYMRTQHRELKESLHREIAQLARALDERYATQTKATDAAYVAQTTAMQTAFTAADKAVQAALESAEKAVSKAEVAAEKRFESVNEFRTQLTDQAASFLTRVEYLAAHDRLVEQIRDLGSRMDREQGRDNGKLDNRTSLYAAIGATGGVIGIVLGFIALIAVFRA